MVNKAYCRLRMLNFCIENSRIFRNFTNPFQFTKKIWVNDLLSSSNNKFLATLNSQKVIGHFNKATVIWQQAASLAIKLHLTCSAFRSSEMGNSIPDLFSQWYHWQMLFCQRCRCQPSVLNSGLDTHTKTHILWVETHLAALHYGGPWLWPSAVFFY